MVSSSSYSDSQFNLAAQGHRQPGSTFKAFVLTTAIKQGIDPYSTYYTSKPLDLDLPEWGHWEVHTADEGYLGARSTCSRRRSPPTTPSSPSSTSTSAPSRSPRRRSRWGSRRTLDGIPAEGIGGLRIGVSPLEMADAYATLAAGGIHRNPVAIRKVVFPDGRVEHPEQADPKRVLPENVAYEVTRILHDNITEGTGTAAYTGCAGQAGKTGTTDRYTDAWFIGYQPNLSTGVWVGYPQSNAIEMTRVHGITVFGGTFPAEIWHAFYTNAGVPCEEFPVPERADQWAPFFGSYTPRSRAATTRHRLERRPAPPAAEGGGGDTADTTRTSTRPAPARSRRRAAPPPPAPPAPPPEAVVAAAASAAAADRRRSAASAARRLTPARVGLFGLIGLAIAAVPLAAPGPALVPATVGGGPDWLLGPFGDGLGVSGGAYYGLLWLGLRLLPRGAARPRRRSTGACSGAAIVVARHRLRAGARRCSRRTSSATSPTPGSGPSTASTPTSTPPRAAPATRPSPTSAGRDTAAPTGRSSRSLTYPLGAALGPGRPRGR